MEKAEIERGLAEAGKPHDFVKYQHMPSNKTDMAGWFNDKHNKITGSVKEKGQFMDQDKWEPPVLILARTIKDDFVYGKPKLDLRYIGLKPNQPNTQFGGGYAPK